MNLQLIILNQALRRDGDLLVREQGRDPFRGPASFGGIIDPAQRLERQRLASIGTKAERVVRTAHRQHDRPRGKTLVEDIDLRVRVTPELKRNQREQHRFAGACRPDHQHVPDVADMGRQAERRRTDRAGMEQWRTVKMGVADRAGPDR